MDSHLSLKILTGGRQIVFTKASQLAQCLACNETSLYEYCTLPFDGHLKYKLKTILFRRVTYQHWRRNLELGKLKKLLNRCWIIYCFWSHSNVHELLFKWKFDIVDTFICCLLWLFVHHELLIIKQEVCV